MTRTERMGLSSKYEALFVACIFAAVFLFSMNAEAYQGGKAPDPLLIRGKVIEREIIEGQTHSYRIVLKSREFSHIRIRQLGVNVAAILYDPRGDKKAESDIPLSNSEAEWLSFIAGTSGEWRIELRTVEKGAPAGRYEIKIEDKRPALPRDWKRVEAQQAHAEGSRLYGEGTDESYRKAIEKYKEALALVRATDRQTEEATILNSIGKAYGRINEHGTALNYYKQALVIYQEIKDRWGEERTLNSIGIEIGFFNSHEEAIKYFEQALEASREVKYRRSEGVILNNLGRAYQYSGQHEKAIKYYEQSLVISREMKDYEGQARTLYNIGLVHNSLKRYEESTAYFEQALVINRELKDQSREGDILLSLGIAQDWLGEDKKAIEYYQQALTIKKESKDRLGEIDALYYLGLVHLALGKPEESIAYLEQSLAVSREVKDRQGEGSAMDGMGTVYSSLRQFEKAIEFYEQALEIAREVKNRFGEAATLKNFGDAYAAMSQNEKAITYFEQELTIRREIQDREGERDSLGNLGTVYRAMSRYEKAIEYYERVLGIERELKDRLGEAFTLNNIGNVYAWLNRYEKAIEYHQQALVISREVNNPEAESDTLTRLASVYSSLGQAEKALEYAEKAFEYYGQAMTVHLRVENTNNEETDEGVKFINQLQLIMGEFKNHVDEINRSDDLNAVPGLREKIEKLKDHAESLLSIIRKAKKRLTEGDVLYLIGGLYDLLDQYDKTIEYWEQALAISREVKDRAGERQKLYDLGNLYYSKEQYDKAREHWEQALAISREVKDRASEAAALHSLMLLWGKQNNNGIAIYYGKQAVNAYQEIRSNIQTLDKESQRSFLRNKESQYRELVDLLISQGRLPEAEKVLDLLKEEEFSKIVRRKASDKSQIALTKAEVEAAKVDDQLAALTAEYGQLLARTRDKTATGEDRRRIEMIERKIADANKQIRIVLSEVKKASPNSKELDDAQAMTSALRRLGQGAVALYTVVTDEKGWIILTAPHFRRAYPIEVKDLRQTVAEFRQALKNDTYDPVLLAQKLYRALFLQPNDKRATLAADLEAYGAKTLMWSLDGVLRYIPMAVLHDGTNYLVARYRNVVFNTASLTRLTDPVSKDWLALGLGVSKAYPGFQPLSGVPRELRAIICDNCAAGVKGVLQGAIRLDEQFTRKAMMDGLRKGYQIVHIATHFSYDVTNEDRSFLLLGDGEHLSIVEMQDFPDVFDAVELLTLSACDTAMGGANGKEIEGLGYVAQKLGAKAVVASLWPVSDDGTEVLMREFYRIKNRYPQMPKSEAFQRAQLALLNGTQTDASLSKNKRKVIVLGSSDDKQTLFKRDPKARFAHPHYWAPFILIGNWK